jgi:hypothetical protein
METTTIITLETMETTTINLIITTTESMATTLMIR